jgi:hypothetical protein
MTNTAAPLQIDTYLPYMRDVIRCEQSLHELNLMWRMIESSAKMNCPVEAKTIFADHGSHARRLQSPGAGAGRQSGE